MNRYSHKKWFAVLLAVIIAVAGILLHRVSGTLLRKLPVETYWYQRAVTQLGSALLSLGFLFGFRKQFVLREKGAPLRTYLLPLTLVLLYAAFRLAAGVLSASAPLRPLPEILAFCLTMLLVGVSEELLHRGVILNILCAAFGTKTFSGALTASLIGGTLFGMIHLFNMLSGIPAFPVIMQAINAAGMGWVFCALYLRCRNIRVLILMHALFDFGGLIPNGVFTVDSTIEDTIAAASVLEELPLIFTVILVVVMLAAYACVTCVLLRKNKMHYGEPPLAIPSGDN